MLLVVVVVIWWWSLLEMMVTMMMSGMQQVHNERKQEKDPPPPKDKFYFYFYILILICLVILCFLIGWPFLFLFCFLDGILKFPSLFYFLFYFPFFFISSEEKRRLFTASAFRPAFMCFSLQSIRCVCGWSRATLCCFPKLCCTSVWLGTTICRVLLVGQHAVSVCHVSVWVISCIYRVSHWLVSMSCFSVGNQLHL